MTCPPHEIFPNLACLSELWRKQCLECPKRFCLITLCLMVLSAAASAQTNLTAKAGSAPAVTPAVESDRSRDGLIGPVRRVRTEVAKLLTADGRQAEGKHVLVEVVAYDIKGNKIENQYFPIAGATLTGKEVYKYDEKGNISEMTLLNADGSLLSKEIYKYEFDFLGNWNKMTTSVAVVDSARDHFRAHRSDLSLDHVLPRREHGEDGYGNTGCRASATPAPVTANPSKYNCKYNSKQTEPKANAANKSRQQKSQRSLRTYRQPPIQRPRWSGPVDVKTPGGVTPQEVPVSLDEPPPAPASPILKPISGGVLNGTAITLPQPVYPEAARRMRASGLVSVEVVLDETGKVVSATATSGPTILREAAVQAALKARFSPTKLSGQPVKGVRRHQLQVCAGSLNLPSWRAGQAFGAPFSPSFPT